MMKKTQLSYAGNLSADALFDMDDDDMMRSCRKLITKKDQLIDEMEVKKLELDFWMQLLSCSSMTELQSQASSDPTATTTFTNPFISSQAKQLTHYLSLTSKMQAARFSENVAASPTKDGCLLLRFLRPPPNPLYHMCLVKLLPLEDGTYSVASHNLPSIIPVSTFEEKYLKKPPEENEQDEHVGLRRFVTSLIQYVMPLYSRQEQVCNYMGVLQHTSVYHKQGCTFLTFNMDVKQARHDDYTQFEVILEYEPCNILPSRVRFEHLGGVVPKQPLEDIMNDLTLKLQEDPFPVTMFSMLGGVEPGTGSEGMAGGVEEDEEGDSDDSEALFG